MATSNNVEKSDLDLRKKKLQNLKQAGYNPYPDRFDKTHLLSEIITASNKQELPQADAIKVDSPSFSTAGRIMTIREHGKLTFANLQDSTTRMQICFSQKILGEEKYEVIKNFDLGDYLGIIGKLFQTKKGETTLMVDEFSFLGKSFRSLPEKFHGLKDQEILYRQRYLDLLTNSDTRDRFQIRAQIIKYLRSNLDQHNFIEVETPILSSTASGALAKPFITHHNALDTDFYLRIAPETYLKRLIVGGYERVYEMAKCFRNEGLDPSHLQEFTMLEYYVAYWNWQDNLKFTEELISSLVKTLFGEYKVKSFNNEIDWQPPFKVITMREQILDDANIDIDIQDSVTSLRLEIAKQGIVIEDIDTLGYGNLVDALFKKVARAKLINPTFIINHPIELSPLARANDENPRVADRFQLVVGGWEIVNAYSELVDPAEQRCRLEKQANLKKAGDEEAMMMDEDYLKAMEYGMPPMSGWGMGIERLLALLTSQENLKDTVFFPLLKPKNAKPSKTVVKDIEISMKEAGITRANADKLLKKYMVGENFLYNHSLAVEAVMVAFAQHFKRNQDVWGLAGLLHDIDYPMTKNEPARHGILAEEILHAEGVHPEIIYAIKAHNYLHELSLNTLLAKTLYSVEELTGLIVACALVHPDKKLSSVTLESLQKKFKQRSFASGVNRAIIEKSEEYLDLKLDQVFKISLSAMQKISDKIEL